MTETKQTEPQRGEAKKHSLLIPQGLRVRMRESSKRPGSIDMGASEIEIIRRALKTRKIIDETRNQLQQEGRKNNITVGNQQLTDEKLRAQMYDLQEGDKSRFNLLLPIQEWERLRENTSKLGTRLNRYI